MKIITLGTFDILHKGHMNLLNKCKELAGDDVVTIGLNTDQFIKNYKGKAPIMTWNERMEVLFSFSQQGDFQIVENGQGNGDAKDIIINSGADLIVIGSDWARKDYVGQLGLDWDWLDDMDIGICYLNYTDGISTTEIKKRINEE